jgi:hypothetical protein
VAANILLVPKAMQNKGTAREEQSRRGAAGERGKGVQGGGEEGENQGQEGEKEKGERHWQGQGFSKPASVVRNSS